MTLPLTQVQIPNVKGQFPFHLGTTSYVVPADMLTNVRLLQNRVDAIQLVLFEGQEDNIPTKNEITELADLKDQSDIEYVVHFPIDRKLGAASSAEGSLALESHLRIAERTISIADAYVVHAEPQTDNAPTLKVLEDALGKIRDSIPDNLPLCLENLNYDFALTDPIRQKHGLQVCVDTGHLSLYAGGPGDFWQTYKSQTTIVHFHGCTGKKEHLSLSRNTWETNQFWLKALVHFHGTVIIETFSQQDTTESLEYLTQWRQSQN